DELTQALRDFEECLVRLGVSKEGARLAASDAECAAVSDLMVTQKDLRLLDLFESVGGRSLAESKGVSRSEIYRSRTEALNRLSHNNISRGPGHLLGQEAA